MTCIVGLVEDGCVVLGGDALTVDGWTCTVCKHAKVWKAGEWVCGVSGAPVIQQLMRYSFPWPELADDADPARWLMAEGMRLVRTLLAEHGQIGRETTNNPQGMDMRDGGMLIGVRGRLFAIGSTFQVIEAEDDYDAIGGGAQVARGALYALRQHIKWPRLPAAQQVLSALEAAARFNASVSAPFTLVATEG